MTNYEKHREQLIEMMANSYRVGVRGNKPVACDAIECDNCVLPDFGSCSDARRAWLNAEASSTLTSDERKLCELLKTGYIAQDEDDDTWYFATEPRKDDRIDWCSNFGETVDVKDVFDLTFNGVHDIKTKAWRIEDLLTLEVCN